VHNLSPFDNELIKHKLREEQDAIHEIKIRVLHKACKQVFKQLYTSLCQDLKLEWILTKRPLHDNKLEAMS
jgi:hypothetical protein